MNKYKFITDKINKDREVQEHNEYKQKLKEEGIVLLEDIVAIDDDGNTHVIKQRRTNSKNNGWSCKQRRKR